MGTYCYTLRKNPIVAIDADDRAPVAIGFAKYAYKYSWMTENPAYARAVGRSHAQAEKARKANPDLTLITIGDPKEHDFDRYGPMAVREVSDRLTSFMDSQSPGKLVGFLYKFGKSYSFEKVTA